MKDNLESVVAHWNAVAEKLLRQHGTIEGTKIFLRQVLHDRLFLSKTAVMTSFGAESALLLKIVAEAKTVAGNNPDVPVIFIDTGSGHPESKTYGLDLVTRLGLTDFRIAGATVEEKISINPLQECCRAVKAKIADRAFKALAAVITGRKRYQGDARSDLQMVGVSDGQIKLNPLAFWTDKEFDAEWEHYQLPRHPLEMMYENLSVCKGCNRGGSRYSKTFCGLHPDELHINGSGI
jgi:phosphoadenosine phosphosulfate reductase